jgi:hypothetical protein
MSTLTSTNHARLVGAVLSVALAALLLATREHIREVVIAPSYSTSTIEELVERADALAIVRVAGRSTSHWNALDGKEWGTLGRDSFVYRDVPVQVIKGLAGDLPSSFTLRDLGGIATGLELFFEGGVKWTAEKEYLVFLEYRHFPTKEGSDDSWTPVRLAQGTFVWSGLDWYEPIQSLHITSNEIAGLASRVGI